MLRKGALESGLGEILLTVLVAAVISGAMFGPLGAKVGQGFKEAEKFTDVTTTVAVDDKATLGSLSKYVFYKAWGCSHVEGENFEGLKSTELTDNGRVPCASAGGTLAASGRNLYANTGGDMEGKYGRINFVINNTITLKTGLGFGPDQKAAILAGVSTGEGSKTGYSDWIWSGCTAYDPVVSDSYISGTAWNDNAPYSYFTLFFKNGGGGDRVTSYGSGETLEARENNDGDGDPLYCNEWNDGPWLSKPTGDTGFPGGDPESFEDTGGNYVAVTLCPGDKGYIETRKAYPNVAGEATGSVASNNNGHLYGMIQITDMNTSCSAATSSTSSALPPLNPMPDTWPPSSTYTKKATTIEYDSGADSNPGEAFVWNLGDNDKTLNLSMVFDSIGKTWVRRTEGGASKMKINPKGSNEIWFDCFIGCSSFEDEIFTDSGSRPSDGYGSIGVTVETGKRYSFVLVDSGRSTNWKVYEEGTLVYELNDDGSYLNHGFKKLQLITTDQNTKMTFDVSDGGS